eukprot:TRINITY_DN81206_c0_g1_i1.p1 TRINITY_DN81206_c0_g1~~TRINITY_DN81206_c0_g1_i1.p1  ORF type:complete len:1013 (-),score=211.78 TRINITY_DN81206_c0_g1_i1:57-3095(-)
MTQMSHVSSMGREDSLGRTPAMSRKSTRCSHGDSVRLRQSITQTLMEERQQAQLKKTRSPAYVRVPRAIAENTIFSVLTTLLTIYALAGDDVRLLATNKPSDIYFDCATAFCLFVFSVEIVCSCLGKVDYFLGFFFYLDTVSTVTLVLDITTVNEELMQQDEEAMDQMKNSRTARIGAKAARVVRVLRLVRILKLYKAIYEARQKAAKKKERELKENVDDWDDEDGAEDHAAQVQQERMASESNVGKKLSDLTTRRCVCLILSMMLVHPLLRPPDETWPASQEYGANVIYQTFTDALNDQSYKWVYHQSLLRYVYFHNWYSQECTEDVVACPALWVPVRLFWMGLSAKDEDWLRTHTDEARLNSSLTSEFEQASAAMQEAGRVMYSYGTMPNVARSTLSSAWDVECRTKTGRLRMGLSLLSDKINDLVDYAIACPEDLRQVERSFKVAKTLTKEQHEEWYFAFYFDNRPNTRAEAETNLLTTLVICIVLCGASMMFSHDAQTLVLEPVESMMLKVHMIRINPLIAAKLTDEAFKAEEVQKRKAAARQRAGEWRFRLSRILNTIMCTAKNSGQAQPMETAILEKTIIKLGTLLALGFGGAGMNIISHNMQGQDSAGVDAMVAGTIVDCVIGYVRMGEFSTFTEVLQSRVMTFVNQVAEIIHGVVDAYQGAPSRNNGDTFLVVWTLPEDLELAATQAADMAIVSCALVLAGVNRSATLAVYRSHPGLQQRLGKNCRVYVTFGVHFGWAIEGALGTEYKIDATYVSPNVSIAEQCERAAEVYGTSVLLTEAVHQMLSLDMSSKCRLIDQVKIRGCLTPLKIFTVDLNYMVLTIERPPKEIRWNTRQRFRARQFLEAEKMARMSPEVKMSSVFDSHEDVVAMRAPYTIEFTKVFGMGYENYSQGEWKSAQRLLRRALSLLGFEDGPSEALLRYMALYQYEAPEWWKGVHHLEDMPSRRTRSVPGVPTPKFEKRPSTNSEWNTMVPVVQPIGSAEVRFAMKEIPKEEPALLGKKLRS